MCKRLSKLMLILLTIFVPVFVFAQDLKDALGDAIDIANILVWIGVSLAVLAFFWGLAQFILKSGNSEAHEGGRRIMIYGTIALFVMLSIWGIIGFLQGEFNLFTGGGTPPIQDTTR